MSVPWSVLSRVWVGPRVKIRRGRTMAAADVGPPSPVKELK